MNFLDVQVHTFIAPHILVGTPSELVGCCCYYATRRVKYYFIAAAHTPPGDFDYSTAQYCTRLWGRLGKEGFDAIRIVLTFRTNGRIAAAASC